MKQLLKAIIPLIALVGCDDAPPETREELEAPEIRKMPEGFLSGLECSVKGPFIYECAMTTAPLYSLVDLVDRATGDAWVVCLQSDDFLYALRTEYGKTHNIEYREAVGMVEKFINQDKQSTFVLTTTEAIKGVKPSYSEEALAQLREAMPDHSEDQFYALFMNQTRRRKLMQSLRKAVPGATQEAIAHVLMERGMFCRKSCLDGGIRVLDKEIRMYWIAESAAVPDGASQPEREFPH